MFIIFPIKTYTKNPSKHRSVHFNCAAASTTEQGKYDYIFHWVITNSLRNIYSRIFIHDIFHNHSLYIYNMTTLMKQDNHKINCPLIELYIIRSDLSTVMFELKYIMKFHSSLSKQPEQMLQFILKHSLLARQGQKHSIACLKNICLLCLT